MNWCGLSGGGGGGGGVVVVVWWWWWWWRLVGFGGLGGTVYIDRDKIL